MKNKKGKLFCGIFDNIHSNSNFIRFTVKQQTIVIALSVMKKRTPYQHRNGVPDSVWTE